MDLSITFRQSGLASGTKLELILASRSPSPVLVALQLPVAFTSVAANGRLIDKFSSDTTLWLILRKFESTAGPNINFTARGIMQSGKVQSKSNQVFYEMPVLNIMGRTFLSFDDYQNSLRQLGICSGTCLIKLDFKKSNQLLEEAMMQIQEYFQAKDPLILDNRESIISTTHEASTTQEMPSSLESFPRGKTARSDEITMEKTPEAVAVQTSTSEVTGSQESNQNNRSMAVYAPPMSEQPRAAAIPHDEADFEPTVEHAKLHQSRLKKYSQNKRLLSDAELDHLKHERLERLENISQISIKVRFPDQSTVVASFKAEETGKNLYDFVTELIVDEHKPFELIWHNRGPQKVPKNDKKLVKDLGFHGRILVNFSWNEGSNQNKGIPILKAQHAQNAKEFVAPTITTSDISELAGNIESVEPIKDVREKDKPKVIGKWFKGLAKK